MGQETRRRLRCYVLALTRADAVDAAKEMLKEYKESSKNERLRKEEV